ncbi:unnamed protein product [Protopolystoma xenopodis]|uniref:Uncharacterized protein n=1 Tax=Protopolystoma xenopodis TaxID=117903 RepID=A0A3S5CMJ4_9PLAT|nr:unnamed protein product [Protopolystoma xenopodis]
MIGIIPPTKSASEGQADRQAGMKVGQVVKKGSPNDDGHNHQHVHLVSDLPNMFNSTSLHSNSLHFTSLHYYCPL